MEAHRSDDGRFARRGVRDARTMYAILRAVAEAAVADRPTADPRKVTTRQWRDARHLCEEEFGHIPLPQEIRRQLAKLKGELLPFPELLSIAFGDRGPIRNVHSQQQAEDRSEEWISDRNVWYALRYVVRSLAPDGEITLESTIRPGPYKRERQRLIEEDARKWKYSGDLAARLPTVHQITTFAGTWDKALQIAELAPRRRTRAGVPTRHSLPLPEAIVRYYEVVGVLPTDKKLLRFRRDYGFAVQSRKGRPFREFLPRALELIAAREDLAPPRPYDETKNLAVTWPVPEQALDAENPSYTRGYTMPEIIAWVIQFLATLGPRQAATQIGWTNYSEAHPGCPSTMVITDRGGLDFLVEKARRPDALARAAAEHEAQLEAARDEQIRADAAKPQALAVRQAMEELGGTVLRLTEIAEHLGWSSGTTGNWLDVLRAAGEVELVDTGVGRKSVRYQLTGLDLTDAELAERQVEAEARLPQPRHILTLLAANESMTSEELVAGTGITNSGLHRWLRRLRTAGYVERISGSSHPRWVYRITERGRELLGLPPSP